MNAILEQVNSMGNAFVGFALPMLIQSSVLIVVLFGLDLFLRKRVKAVFRYWIWMIVLLKLVLPTTLSSPTSPAYWFGNELHSMIPEEPLAMSSPTDMPIAAPALTGLESSPVSFAETIAPASSMTWQGCVFLAWLAAVLIMTALLIQRAFFVRRLIAESGKASDAIMNTLERAREQMGIGKAIALRLSPAAASPAVCGLLRPTILIPRGLPDEIDPRHLKSILLHELAHIKRADLWVNSIQAIVQIIYIYNPLLWVANAVIRKVREQAVDEMVLVAMGDQAEEYPRTLVNISRLAFGSPGLSLRLIGVVESKKALIGRIKHITSRPFPTNAKLGIGGLVVVMILCAVLLPMARAQKTEEKPAVPAREKVQEATQSLHKAAKDGDLERVKSLIAQGADVNAQDEKGWTPLHAAAGNGHEAVVEILIEQGADIKARNNKGSTPLHAAAWPGHKAVVKVLLEHNATVNAQDKKGATPLYHAAWEGHKDVVEILLEQGADVNMNRVGESWTPLLHATMAGHAPVVKALLENGAKVDVGDDSGVTPLCYAIQDKNEESVRMLIEAGADVNKLVYKKLELTALSWAVWFGNAGIVQILIEAGANINHKDDSGWTPLYYAIDANDVDIAKLLVGTETKFSDLHRAILERDLAQVTRLVESGTHVDTKDGFGWTPSCWAVNTGQKEILEYLLNNGADVNAKRDYGSTLLFQASKGSFTTITEQLIAKGANVNVRNNGGRSPLHNAASGGRTGIVKLLLAKGANVNVRDKNGETPLLRPASKGHADIVKLLVAKGIDINAARNNGTYALGNAAIAGHEEIVKFLIDSGAEVDLNVNGNNTALANAAYKGHSSIVDLLIDNGAEVNMKATQNGAAPLHYAAGQGHLKVARLLIDAGANVNATNNEGNTPLDLARKKGHQEVSKMLLNHGAEEGISVRDLSKTQD